MDRMSMTLSEALSIRSAFNLMKKKLSDEGIDTSDVQYITDLPALLCGIVPDDVADEVDALVEGIGEEGVLSLLNAFTDMASRGGLSALLSAFLPGDKVEEGDLYA